MTQHARRPFIGGNWKMHTNLAGALELADDIVASCKPLEACCDIALFPPFPYLHAVGKTLGHHAIILGAQNVWCKPNGAFTGEVSVDMLNDLHVQAVIVGHSERRHIIGESDELIHLKLRAALAAKLTVVLCLGETWQQREAGQADAVNLRQLNSALKGVTVDEMSHVVVAYEPVWAIGSGKTASPHDAQSAHHAVRSRLADLFTAQTAAATRIIYGGSVTPANAHTLFAQPDVDGGLIGGASLKAADFTAICNAVKR